MAQDTTNKEKPNRRWITPVFLAAMGILLLGMIFRYGFQDPEPYVPKVGFIVLGDVNAPGWSASHYEGISAACDALGADLFCRDRVEENSGACLTAVRELADEGCRLIALASFYYPEEILPYLNEFPNISFVSIAPTVPMPNMTVFFTRMYQGRYLAGALAGMQSKSGVIGYVAAMPNAQVNRGINAFLLGARRTNPDARVVVAWINSWSDPDREALLTERLVREAGADIITYHADNDTAARAADALGVKSILYSAPVPKELNHALGAVNSRWDIFYTDILHRHLKGELHSHHMHWIGVEKNAVLLTSLSPEVTESMHKTLDSLRLELVDHRLIFRGLLYDNQGIMRCGPDETISDAKLLENVDWLISGVTVLE